MPGSYMNISIPLLTLLLEAAWCLLVNVGAQLPDVIKIGALVDTDQEELEEALQTTVDQINKDYSVLPSVRMEINVKRISPYESFYARKEACSLLEEETVAIIGPSTPPAAALVRSASDSLHFPYIQTSWDMWSSRHNYSISLYPHSQRLSKAYLDLVTALGWKSFTIVYENNENLLRQEDLLRSSTFEGVKVTLRQVRPGQSYKKLLKDVASKGETNIVLDIPSEKLYSVLKNAEEVGLMKEFHNYFILNLDLHTIDLEYFHYGRTNITGFRIVNVSNYEVHRSMKGHTKILTPKQGTLKTQTALYCDGLHMIARALHNMSRVAVRPSKISCTSPKHSPFGYTLVNRMRSIQYKGLSGNVKIDQMGQRTEFVLDIIELKREGFAKIGTWNSNAGVKITRDYNTVYHEVLVSLKNRTLRVSTILL